MSRFVFLAVAAVAAGGWLAAAPVPTDVRALVAGLSDPSAKVRDEAATALRGRADALPWLRRAARSTDRDTAQRAAALLAPHEPKRQAAVAKAIDACIRDGRVDLFMEWHHYWQPESKGDLWPVGPRMVRVLLDESAKWGAADQVKRFEPILDHVISPRFKPQSHDGPLEQIPRTGRGNASWSIRTDRWPEKAPSFEELTFVSVAGPAQLGGRGGGRFFVLGPAQKGGDPWMRRTFVACDGDVRVGSSYGEDRRNWGTAIGSFVVCRGTYRGGGLLGSVLLVDGDVELFEEGRECRVVDSVIRATGEVRLPRTAVVADSTIREHAKIATAPYRFFELGDAGLSVVDDEEGLVVAGVTPGTPFGTCGLVKGDVIQAIDDAGTGGHSSAFTRKVRRAVVRQGDCLLTVARGDKTLDLPVYFPLPK